MVCEAEEALCEAKGDPQCRFQVRFFEKTKNIEEMEDAERIVVDSLTSLLIQYSDPFVVRKETLSMNRSLSEPGRYTSILLSELSEEREMPQFKAEMFLANGVILLHTIKRAEESESYRSA